VTATHWQIVRFGVVGVLATLVHYLVLHFGADRLGISPVIMTGIAFCVAVCVTYTGQTLWVFAVKPFELVQLFKFGISVISGLIGNMAIMAFVVNGLGGGYQAGFAAGVVLVPVFTFVFNKYWVFAEKL
jgi:putative flippase GtrA